MKFSIVGCLNVGVAFLVFYLCYVRWQLGTFILVTMGNVGNDLAEMLHQIGVPSINAAFANVAGYLTGMINSFVLNKTWTFGVRKTSMTQMWRFFVVSIFGLTSSTLALFIFVDVLGKPYLLTWFIATASIMTLNFLGTKYWALANNDMSVSKMKQAEGGQRERRRWEW